jgi:hypothetical protein
MSDVNWTITIHDEERLTAKYQEGGKKQSVTAVGKLGRGTNLARLTVERLNRWLNYSISKQEEKRRGESPCELDDLKVLGLNLSEIIFGDESTRIGEEQDSIKEQFTRHYKRFDPKDPNSHLRLRLIFEKGAARLAGLPWEFLFVSPNDEIGDGFFIAGQKSQLTLTRFVPESKLIKDLKPLQEKKLKILLICSNPQDLGESIDTKVVAEVESRLNDLRSVEVKKFDNQTFEQLRKLIHEDFCPRVVHFIGHGKEGKLALVKSPEDHDYDRTLADEDRKVQARWIDMDDMRKLFADRGLRLIFLHACKGATATTLDGFKSTAGYLADLRIPAVVAMQYNIFNEDAGIFARTFYEEIGKGKDIDEAVEAGRVKLNDQMPAWYPRFGTPVVYLHSNEAAIISPGAAGDDGKGRKKGKPKRGAEMQPQPAKPEVSTGGVESAANVLRELSPEQLKALGFERHVATKESRPVQQRPAAEKELPTPKGDVTGALGTPDTGADTRAFEAASSKGKN